MLKYTKGGLPGLLLFDDNFGCESDYGRFSSIIELFYNKLYMLSYIFFQLFLDYLYLNAKYSKECSKSRVESLQIFFLI